MRFTVLASGSSGNSSLIAAGGFGVLLDIGLGPRLIASRLAVIGAAWQQVNAVLLTHTHGDHWKRRTLAQLHRQGIPLYCHRSHQQDLDAAADEFSLLRKAGLVRTYEAGQVLELAPGFRCRALPLSHDAGATFGFRVEA